MNQNLIKRKMSTTTKKYDKLMQITELGSGLRFKSLKKGLCEPGDKIKKHK